MYDPIKKKIIVSKDVKFDENRQWNSETREIERACKDKAIIDEVNSETCSTSKHSDNANEVDNGSQTDDHQYDTLENDIVEEVPDSEDNNDDGEVILGREFQRGQYILMTLQLMRLLMHPYTI
jgi:hypothetical protein